MRKFVISVLSLILVFANSAAQESRQSKVEVPVNGYLTIKSRAVRSQSRDEPP